MSHEESIEQATEDNFTATSPPCVLLAEDNKETYSIELAHLLLASASEVDVVLKALCKKIDNKRNPVNIDDCREVFEMFIPDGFSPNGDNKNDLFKIKGIKYYPNAKMKIYNRWGNLVYENDHYGNEDLLGGHDAWWDGRSQHDWDIGDKPLPTGTYIYTLDLGDGNVRSGTIFIYR